MREEKYEWLVRGDCVEGCTSPPVCPAYWNSPMQAQVHNGQSQCEGVWTFNIGEGYCGDVNLNGLLVSCGFNSPSPFPPLKKVPWQSIIYLDEKANAQQAEALEKIYGICLKVMGDVIMTKRARITFEKESVDSGPAAKHWVQIEGIYKFVASPFRTFDNKPMYINSRRGGYINVGISEVNEFNDPDLPRGKWNAPKMSVTYYDFVINPSKPYWLP